MRNHVNPIILLGLAIVSSGCDDGPTPIAAEAEVPSLLGLGDDWTPIEDGVWERYLDDGTTQHLGLGAGGKRAALAALAEVGERLNASQAADPTPEHADQIREHAARVAEVAAEPVEDIDGLLVRLRGCVLSTSVSVFAGSANPGAKATASAGYFNNCDGVTATVRTYALASVGYNQTTHSCGPKTGLSVSCSSSTSLYGTSNCYSHAEASISRGSVFVWQDSWSCGSGSGYPSSTSVGTSSGGGSSGGSGGGSGGTQPN